MKTTKELLNKKTKVAKVKEKPNALTKTEIKSVQKPYVASEVKTIADKLGMNLEYILNKVKDIAESTMVIEEPMEEILRDEFDNPINIKQLINGEWVEIPLTTPKKRLNPDTEKVEVVTILKRIPNFSNQKWAVTFLSDLLIAPPSKETNISVGLNHNELTGIDEAVRQIEADPELEETLLRLIGEEKKEEAIQELRNKMKETAVEAEFEEELPEEFLEST